MYKISFIGAGNVTFRLSLALKNAGNSIECIYNRNIENAEKVVRALKRNKSNAFATSDISQVPESDIIIVAVSDNAISQVIPLIKDKSRFIVHTSGATSIDVFKENGFTNYGVFYPLMTLSKNKDIDFKLVPFLIESKNNIDILVNLCAMLKAEYKVCDSNKRLQMHTAAVFSTNFINYLLTLSYEIAYPDFTFLLPCAIESVRKAFLNTPMVSQTGPAKRNDLETIEKHLQYLKENGKNEQYQIYKMLTEGIIKKYNE